MTTRVINGDCLVEMRKLAEEGVRVDAVVTDPPYHLTSIVKRFGGENAAPAKSNGATGVYARSSRGFMGKVWDGGDIAFQPETWALAAALMKPGAHLVAFGGSRTFHRVACAIEDAGLEIRDTLFWLYGSGFPKSLNVQQAINKAARGCPQGTSDPLSPNHGKFKGGCSDENTDGRGFGAGAGHFMREQGVARGGDEGPWQGWGTALKPAHEPIILARKPLDGTVAANVLRHGCGALNIDGCRVGTSKDVPASPRGPVDRICGAWGAQTGKESGHNPNIGRWPANILHDGSPEVLEAFARFGESKSSDRPRLNTAEAHNRTASMGKSAGDWITSGHSDTGTAARFFYCAKASREDRAGSKHPTVKPLSLMRWLCRLVTPPGGTILDPFAGSGTTLQAASEEGFRAIGIEQEAEYVADIERRMAQAKPHQADIFAGAAA